MLQPEKRKKSYEDYIVNIGVMAFCLMWVHLCWPIGVILAILIATNYMDCRR